jgi:hypothetical protein
MGSGDLALNQSEADMQLRRRAAAILVGGAALTTLAMPGTAQAATATSVAPQVAPAARIPGVWRAIVDEAGFITDFWWWPY